MLRIRVSLFIVNMSSLTLVKNVMKQTTVERIVDDKLVVICNQLFSGQFL